MSWSHLPGKAAITAKKSGAGNDGIFCGAALAFYGGNIMNLLNIMVDKGEQGLVLKDLDEDEITAAMQVKADA